MIKATLVADSVGPNGKRLSTFELQYPRYIHAEVMTHRMFSRNAASSRAIPVQKMIERVKNDPVLPLHWGKNQPGMQADGELDASEKKLALLEWLQARDLAVIQAEKLLAVGLHKQVVNRILEPWMWMVSIVSATDWGNFFNLRIAPDAQPEIQALAGKMLWELNTSEPRRVLHDDWHLPYVSEEERKRITPSVLLKYSVARCARVSYLNHDGTKPDHTKDIELHDRLVKAPHASPFEHQATPLVDPYRRSGNFQGWMQYRKTLVAENRPDYARLKRVVSL